MQQNSQISLDEMIRQILLKQKITQFQLAKILGVSHPQISRWRNGDNKPRRRIMAKIQQIYDDLTA